MNEKPLDNADRSFLNAELVQGVIPQILILVVGGLLYWVGFIFISRSNPFEFDSSLVLTFYTILVLMIFTFIIWKNLKFKILDLKYGVKIVMPGKIESKSDNTKYGWTANPVVDARTQPKLVEFYMTINGINYFVEETEFKKFKIGDSVNLHVAKSTGQLIKIEKSI